MLEVETTDPAATCLETIKSTSTTNGLGFNEINDNNHEEEPQDDDDDDEILAEKEEKAFEKRRLMMNGGENEEEQHEEEEEEADEEDEEEEDDDVDDDETESSEASENFLETYLVAAPMGPNGNDDSTEALFSYKEHEAAMRKLNAKWEHVLNDTLSQSEELLIEQAKITEDERAVMQLRAKEEVIRAKEHAAHLENDLASLHEQYDAQLTSQRQEIDRLQSALRSPPPQNNSKQQQEENSPTDPATATAAGALAASLPAGNIREMVQQLTKTSSDCKTELESIRSNLLQFQKEAERHAREMTLSLQAKAEQERRTAVEAALKSMSAQFQAERNHLKTHLQSSITQQHKENNEDSKNINSHPTNDGTSPNNDDPHKHPPSSPSNGQPISNDLMIQQIKQMAAREKEEAVLKCQNIAEEKLQATISKITDHFTIERERAVQKARDEMQWKMDEIRGDYNDRILDLKVQNEAAVRRARKDVENEIREKLLDLEEELEAEKEDAIRAAVMDVRKQSARELESAVVSMREDTSQKLAIARQESDVRLDDLRKDYEFRIQRVKAEKESEMEGAMTNLRDELNHAQTELDMRVKEAEDINERNTQLSNDLVQSLENKERAVEQAVQKALSKQKSDFDKERENAISKATKDIESRMMNDIHALAEEKTKMALDEAKSTHQQQLDEAVKAAESKMAEQSNRKLREKLEEAKKMFVNHLVDERKKHADEVKKIRNETTLNDDASVSSTTRPEQVEEPPRAQDLEAMKAQIAKEQRDLAEKEIKAKLEVSVSAQIRRMSKEVEEAKAERDNLRESLQKIQAALSERENLIHGLHTELSNLVPGNATPQKQEGTIENWDSAKKILDSAKKLIESPSITSIMIPTNNRNNTGDAKDLGILHKQNGLSTARPTSLKVDLTEEDDEENAGVNSAIIEFSDPSSFGSPAPAAKISVKNQFDILSPLTINSPKQSSPPPSKQTTQQSSKVTSAVNRNSRPRGIRKETSTKSIGKNRLSMETARTGTTTSQSRAKQRATASSGRKNVSISNKAVAPSTSTSRNRRISDGTSRTMPARAVSAFSTSPPPERSSVKLIFLNVPLTDRLKQMAKQLGVEIVDSPMQATHCIAGDAKHSIRRTPKFMVCICRTPNILHLDWLMASSRDRKLANTGKHLLLNDKAAEEQFAFSMEDALREGEERRKEGGLLAGWNVLFCPTVAGRRAPKEEDLNMIVDAAGGSIVRYADLPLKDSDHEIASRTLVITSDPPLSSQTSDELAADVAKVGAGFFTTTWLFDCIMRQKLDGIEI